MSLARIALLVATATLITACGGSQTCDKPQIYESARPGQKIEVPEGLDPLPTDNEVPIPQASRKNERAEGDPCLDYPPVLRTSSDDD